LAVAENAYRLADVGFGTVPGGRVTAHMMALPAAVPLEETAVKNPGSDRVQKHWGAYARITCLRVIQLICQEWRESTRNACVPSQNPARFKSLQESHPLVLRKPEGRSRRARGATVGAQIQHAFWRKLGDEAARAGQTSSPHPFGSCPPPRAI
jgi:hypothetical protein